MSFLHSEPTLVNRNNLRLTARKLEPPPDDMRELELDCDEAIWVIARNIGMKEEDLVNYETDLVEHDELLTRYVLDLVLEWKRKKQE